MKNFEKNFTNEQNFDSLKKDNVKNTIIILKIDIQLTKIDKKKSKNSLRKKQSSLRKFKKFEFVHQYLIIKFHFFFQIFIKRFFNLQHFCFRLFSQTKTFFFNHNKFRNFSFRIY